MGEKNKAKKRMNLFRLVSYKIRTTIRQRKWLLMTVICFITSFGFGVFAYSSYPEYNIWDSIYSTFRLYTLDVEIPVGERTWELEVARWLSAFVIVSNIIRTIFYIFRQEWRLLMLSFGKKGHYIICGLNQSANELATELRKNKKKVVIIEMDRNNVYIEEQRKQKSIVIIGDAKNENVLMQALITKCSHFLIMTSSDGENLDILITAREIMKAQSTYLKGKPVKYFLHLIDKQYEKILDSITIESKDQKVDIRAFNLYENAARKLLNEHPLYENLDIVDQDATPGHFVILGFGHVGRHVLLEALKRAHFPNGKKLKITVVDKQATLLESKFKRRYPNADHYSDIEFVEHDVDTIEFHDYMKDLRSSITYIAVCFDNDELDYIGASLLFEDFHDIPIAVRMTTDLNIAQFIHNSPEFDKLIHFGSIEEISTMDYIIGEKIESFAKEFHYGYNEVAGYNETWEEISRFKKKSNIALAEHVDTKLYALGLQRVPNAQANKEKKVEKKEFEKLVEPLLENLAKAEHKRWNTFHYLHGWTKQPANMEKSKDPIQRTHECLVEWEELDEVSQFRSKREKKKIDYKSYDRDQVTNLYEALEKVEYKIVER